MQKQIFVMRLFLTGIFLLLILSTAWADSVTIVNDPAGDFAASYTGPKNGDLDVLKTQGSIVGTSIIFSTTLNGNVGSTDGAFFVFGLNRGAGIARFGTITTASGTYDATNVKFDSVVIFRPGVSLTVTDQISNVSTTLSLSNVSINGNSFDLTVPIGLLPSQGFAVSQYTFNLWPRFGGVTGNGAISDFAPNNSNAPLAETPEPATIILLSGGLAGLVFRKRRNR